MRRRTLVLTLIAATVLPAGQCLRVERPYKTPSAIEILHTLRNRFVAVQSYRGEARMSFQTSQDRPLKASVRMMAQKDGKLRFDVVSPIDAPLATLVTSSGRFSLVDSRKHSHYFGPASPCNLARLLMVPISANDVLAALSGFAPLIAYKRLELSWDGRAGQEILVLHGATQRQVLRIDGRDRSWRMLQSEIVNNDGSAGLSLAFSNHKKVAGVLVPTRIRLRQPSQGAELTLEFKHQELNAKLPAAAFEQLPADGLPSREVECEDPGATTPLPSATTQPANTTSQPAPNSGPE